MHARRSFLSACFLSVAAVWSLPAHAESLPKPFVAYDDELKAGWQNWSWAKAELSVPAGGAKPIKVSGDAWSALSLHHDAFSTEGFSKITFNINGGATGGQVLMVRVMVDGKPVESNYAISPKAKTWALVEVPLKELGAEGKVIDGIALQGKESAYSAYYVTRIQLE